MAVADIFESKLGDFVLNSAIYKHCSTLFVVSGADIGDGGFLYIEL